MIIPVEDLVYGGTSQVEVFRFRFEDLRCRAIRGFRVVVLEIHRVLDGCLVF